MPDTTAAPEVTPDWPTCTTEQGCIGRRIDSFDACLAHLNDDDLDTALASYTPGADVDLRGTSLTPKLIARLLAVMSPKSLVDRPARPRVGRADFQHCRFTPPPAPHTSSDSAADFRSVTFAERANFFGSTFTRGADFSGATFTKGANFFGSTFTRGADFSGATFTESADFSGATFTWVANFRSATFTKGADFSGATFTWGADFRSATFTWGADFSGATFTWGADFFGATFTWGADFRGATFTGGANFIGATFTRSVDFRSATFTGSVDFRDATFCTGVVRGLLVANRFVLDGARFEQHSIVEVAAGEFSAVGARFDGGVELRVGYAQVSLRRAFFGAPSSLTGLPAPFASSEAPRGVTPGQVRVWVAERVGVGRSVRRGGVEEWVPRLLSVQETDVAQLTVADVDLSGCRFAGAHHLDELRVEGVAPFNRPPGGWRVGWAWPPVWRWSERRVLAEERLWRAQHRKHGGWSEELPDLHPEMSTLWVGPERLAVLYRSLRKAFEDNKNEAGAGDFYYGEMDARRHAPSTSRAERLVLTAYWLVSGYGQRAGRALALLVATVGVLFALLTTYGLPDNSATQQVIVPAAPTAGQVSTGVLEVRPAPTALPPAGQRWTADRAGKAIRVVLGSVVFRDTDQRLTPAGVWTVMAGRALGPLLLALAALAIRARVKR
ncbi:pentapeptide repeat-containing protein [Actinokineospora cianjurensis]|uniref:Uncharacterized protein YjbI with pentapeptide repeats n=1 Tax=Actinokineospora cianjurensis TaxID=585224 RepID=A0A421B204_9PSEU|nr:pentapeptide repeat-containing protein [Actinokineospora cianjurensis]RLK58400.1 uncharacterized protein YjbI with pentapeptide repeats [Actinokineospora cianjurensis]